MTTTTTCTSKASAAKAFLESGGGSCGSNSAEHWQRQVAEAAYYRAEKRGFIPGNELQDWLEAEQELRQ